MFSQSNRIMLISTALLAIATSPAIAGTVVVKKSGGNPTIQDGVNAASAGDKIEVRSGTYQENVTIPAGKDGLRLYAKGTVILDALPSGGVGVGPGITIQSANVTLEGFTIRNAQWDGMTNPHNGYGVSMEASDLTLKKMHINGNEDAGVEDNGNSNLTVTQCTFSGYSSGPAVMSSGASLMVKNTKFYSLYYEGVYSEGSDATIKNCDFWSIYDYAIEAEGANILVEDNKFRACYSGVYVDAPAASGFTINNNTFAGCNDTTELYNTDGTVQSQIKNNTISGGYYGLYLSGCSNVLIRKNRIEYVSDYPMYVNGSDNIIDQNEVSNVNAEGIDISGDNPTITDNVVDGISDGYDGITISNATGGVVSGNVVKRIAGYTGIVTTSSTSNLLIENNSVRWCGDGFYIDGNDHTVRSNTARDCSEDGFIFRSTGSDFGIYDNTAEWNYIDGFDIEATNCEATGNVSVDNGAEGIEVNGDNNIINNNKSKRNRIDMANDGAGNAFSGNNYDTGGDATPPEID